MITPYCYYAVVRSIYDGDTMRLDIDMGLSNWVINEPCRLSRIDTPELRGKDREAGLKARDWLRDRLPIGSKVLIKTELDRGKYGRVLAEIYDLEGRSINQELLDNGLANPYE